jgi:hypothetical protein
MYLLGDVPDEARGIDTDQTVVDSDVRCVVGLLLVPEERVRHPESHCQRARVHFHLGPVDSHVTGVLQSRVPPPLSQVEVQLSIPVFMATKRTSP